MSRRNFGKLLGLASVVPLAGSLGGCGGGGDDSTPAALSPPPTSYAISKEAKVTVTGGELQGANLSSGVRSFLGVPYAAPPVGKLRWKAPQPIVPWSGTKATQTNPPPAASGANLNVTLNGTSTVIRASEDCLYLNMWVPKETTGTVGQWPVLVWTHGGGGHISETRIRGEQLAKKGMIVVLAARRQGVFASLAHATLSAETENNKSSGNLDVLDLICALKWVQNNIAKFGGDPNKVTMSGQSAGSNYVAKLHISPLAKGLFSKVFSESGSPYRGEFKTTGTALADAEAAGATWVAKFGAGTTIADLRNKTLEEIVAVSGSFANPVIDNYVFPDTPQNIMLAGKQNDVPLFIGFCRDEVVTTNVTGVTDLVTYKSALLKKFGVDYDAVFNLFPAFSNADALTQIIRLNNDIENARVMTAWARLQKKTGKFAAYMFIFYRANSRGLAKHGADVSYWFGNLYDPYSDNTYPYTTAADFELTERMMDALFAFCTTGNPNTSSVTVPEFDRSSEYAVGLDVNAIARVPIDKGVDWFCDHSDKY
jgi:para-nitrobenzyl esterase